MDLRFVLRHLERERELTAVVPDGGETTIGDLAEAAHPGAVPGSCDWICVDGVRHPRHATLGQSRVRHGSIIEVGGLPRERRSAAVCESGGPLTLHVVGGAGAGKRLPLAPGTWTVGRDGSCNLELADASVSRRHCLLEVDHDGSVRLTDLRSTNGVSVGSEQVDEVVVALDQVVTLGAVKLATRREIADRPSTTMPGGPGPCAAFTEPFNRPPRPPIPARPEPLTPPAPPGPGSSPARLSWAATLTPLLLGAVMAVLFSPLMALFALLSPVMVVAGWVESRREASRSSRAVRRRRNEGLGAFERALRAAADLSRERLAAMHPDLAEVMRRGDLPSVRLWERRPGEEDFLRLRVGLGSAPWDPPLAEPVSDEAASLIVRGHDHLESAPVIIDLACGGIVGIVGDPATSGAVARSLVAQVVVHHGPADVRLAVMTSHPASASWSWAHWLPHVADPAGGRGCLAGEAAAAQDLAQRLLDDAAGEPERRAAPVNVVVVEADLCGGSANPIRALLSGLHGPSAGVVLARSADQLPARCSTIIEIHDRHGAGLLLSRLGPAPPAPVLLDQFGEAEATTLARRLARWEDPERPVLDDHLPDTVALAEVLALPEPVEGVLDAWRANRRRRSSLAAPVGVDGAGVMSVDLVGDGPHALIAGTTGSGKSELLRTLVVALAANHDTEHLSFVLVDYKGGSAFDACHGLPHTVGVVTDLDEHLGERALRCLDAELRRRERLLREHGAEGVEQYHDRRRTEANLAPLPRLVVVIDEFATLAAELPEFMRALVGIAQRGRSLGIHLVLATQRPAGAVSEDIRANTSLRVALRVADAGDSTEVIGVPDAARISPHRPGRALIRRSAEDLRVCQVASGAIPAAPTEQGIRVAALDGAAPTPPHPCPADPTALGCLVDTVALAHRSAGLSTPAPPWPAPLPEVVALEALLPAGRVACSPGTALPLAVADDPDRQRQYPVGWDPTRGNLLVLGVAGSGTTTALVSAGLALGWQIPPDRLHLYGLDFDMGTLEILTRLPHTGGVVRAADHERQWRLTAQLQRELERRQGGRAAGSPLVVVLVDNLQAYLDEHDNPAGYELIDRFRRLVRDGPSLGMAFAVTARSPVGLPADVSSSCAQRLVLELGDPHDYAALGLRAVPPARCRGRGNLTENGLEVQVGIAAHPDEAVDEIVRRHSTITPTAPAVKALPDRLDIIDLRAEAELGPQRWWLPLGLGERDLAPVGFELAPGDHALIAGPARSGRSSALCSIAQIVARTRPGTAVLAYGGRSSALDASPALRCSSIEALAEQVEATRRLGRAWLLLIDDADRVEDSFLDTLVRGVEADGRLIAAGRAARLHGMYGHWTNHLRRAGVGLLLMPDPVLDGELLGCSLPRNGPRQSSPGLGYLVHPGDTERCRVAVAGRGR